MTATPPRIVVVGLGPGGADLVTLAARTTLESAEFRYVRTVRHPAVEELARRGLEFRGFDDLYDTADDLSSVYPAIVEALVTAATEHGSIVYAVPGSPAVAEHTVELLHEAATSGRVRLDIEPGMSFAELAWARLGVDPMTIGARVVDGRSLDPSLLDSGGPVLVAQCDHALVLSDVKLTLLERLPPTTTLTVLQRLGLPDERITEVALAELDRAVAPDHLTAVWVPGGTSAAGEEIARLLDLTRRLRAPDGCPWDAAQTHHSITRYLLEEAYEAVEAVERLPAGAPEGASGDDPAYAGLRDELGDLLYQITLHSTLAEEAGAFDLAAVARGVHDKLVRRHPHVFGDAVADTPDAVTANWEQLKKSEKGTDSLVDDITPGLPSLLYAHKLARKSASVGLDPGDVSDSTARIEAASRQLREAGPDDDTEALLGGLLAAAVALARALGVDAESALRGWVARFRDRFEAMERLAAVRGVDLHAADRAVVEELWREADPS